MTNLCTAPGTYCEVSSPNPGTTCQRAIDGILEFAPGIDWVSDGEGSGAWFKVSVIRKIRYFVNLARASFYAKQCMEAI